MRHAITITFPDEPVETDFVNLYDALIHLDNPRDIATVVNYTIMHTKKQPQSLAASQLLLRSLIHLVTAHNRHNQERVSAGLTPQKPPAKMRMMFIAAERWLDNNSMILLLNKIRNLDVATTPKQFTKLVVKKPLVQPHEEEVEIVVPNASNQLAGGQVVGTLSTNTAQVPDNHTAIPTAVLHTVLHQLQHSDPQLAQFLQAQLPETENIALETVGDYLDNGLSHKLTPFMWLQHKYSTQLVVFMHIDTSAASAYTNPSYIPNIEIFDPQMGRIWQAPAHNYLPRFDLQAIYPPAQK